MKTALADVEGIESIDAPGNVPKICFVNFSSSKLMRDFVHTQKSLPEFGPKKMWASPSSSPHDRKIRAVLNEIKRGICEHFNRSSESILINAPSKYVYSMEAGRQLRKLLKCRMTMQ